METKDEFTKFVKRWTVTVVYIAIVLTAMFGVKLYEVFYQ